MSDLSLVDPTETSYSSLAQRAKELVRKVQPETQQPVLPQTMGSPVQPQIQQPYQVSPEVTTPWQMYGNMPANPDTGLNPQQQLVQALPYLMHQSSAHAAKAAAALDQHAPGLGKMALQFLAPQFMARHFPQKANPGADELALSGQYAKQAELAAKLITDLPKDSISAVHNHMSELSDSVKNSVEVAKLMQDAYKYTTTGQTHEASQTRNALAEAMIREQQLKSGLPQAQAAQANANAALANYQVQHGGPQLGLDLKQQELQNQKQEYSLKANEESNKHQTQMHQQEYARLSSDVDREESRLDAADKRLSTLKQRASGEEALPEDKKAVEEAQARYDEIKASRDRSRTQLDSFLGHTGVHEAHGTTASNPQDELKQLVATARKNPGSPEAIAAAKRYMELKQIINKGK